MADVVSSASIVWEGNVARGSGAVSSDRGAFAGVPVDLPTRIGEAAAGKSTPEELLAAAHVACLTMSVGTALAERRTPAERLEATSTVTLDLSGRPRISRVAAEVRGVVPGVDEETFQQIVREEAEDGCLISRVVSGGGVTVEASGRLA